MKNILIAVNGLFSSLETFGDHKLSHTVFQPSTDNFWKEEQEVATIFTVIYTKVLFDGLSCETTTFVVRNTRRQGRSCEGHHEDYDG